MTDRNRTCDGARGNIKFDSYMEEQFYELCVKSEDTAKVFYEWQTNKERYIKTTNTTVLEFQNYSMHDKTHSLAIITAIEKVLGIERIDQLGVGDLWLILNAAYAHDIGMATRYEEIVDLWKSDDKFHEYISCLANQPERNLQKEARYYLQLHNILNDRDQMEGLNSDKYRIVELTRDWPVRIRKNVMILTNEYIRREHPKRGQDYLTDYFEELGVKIAQSRFYKVLGKIVLAHNEDFEYLLNDIDEKADGFGLEDEVHPQFIAALLRLGDLLDMDNDRFDPFVLAHFGELPDVSKAHYQRHLDLTHQLVTEKKIEARVETEDRNTARLALSWFRMLEDESKNLVNNWNRIAPLEMGGCRFDRCDLRVYLKGELYTQSVCDSFTVDDRKFMDILIGNKLYDDPFVFVREYLQNAIDATKMMLNIRMNAEWSSGCFSGKGKDYLERIPLELNRDYLKELSIQVKLSVVKSEETGEEKIRITFQDRGIGMEEDCFKEISVIGSGWNGRKKYRDALRSTIFWLYPTGGFGIGLQSGFMVTDEIQIRSRGYQEAQGYQVTMKSPRVGGNIDLIKIADKMPVGTEISLEVEKETIVELMHKNGKQAGTDPQPDQKIYFQTTRLLKTIGEYLTRYIKQVIPNSFFPIQVCYPGISGEDQKEEITGRIYNTLNSGENIIYNEKYHCMYQWVKKGVGTEEGYFSFWDYDNKLYAEICTDRESNADVVCYRGIQVDDFMERPVFINFKFISEGVSFFVDTLDDRAEEWLLISRSGFQPKAKMRLEKMALRAFRVYINLLLEDKNRAYARKSISPLFTGIAMFGKEWGNSEKESLKKINVGLEGSRIQIRKASPKSGEDTEGMISVVEPEIITPAMFFDAVSSGDLLLWKKQSVDINNVDKNVPRNKWENILRECSSEEEPSLERSALAKQLCSGTGLLVILNGQKAFPVKFSDSDVTQSEIYFASGEGKLGAFRGLYGCLEFKEKRTAQDETDIDQSLRNAFEAKQDYMAVEKADEYKELLLSKLPEGENTEEFCNMRQVILLPIDGATFQTYELDKKLTWDDFWTRVQGTEYWKYAVDWTLRHPKDKKIRAGNQVVVLSYQRLCTRIFELIKADSKKSG